VSTGIVNVIITLPYEAVRWDEDRTEPVGDYEVYSEELHDFVFLTKCCYGGHM